MPEISQLHDRYVSNLYKSLLSARVDPGMARLGWLSVLGWQAAFASICFLCGTLIQGFLVVNYPGPEGYTYDFKRWHGTLLTMAIAVVGTFVNTFLSRFLASLEGLILIIHVFGFFGILIPLWVCGDTASNSTVWAQFANSGGWQTTGLAVVIGQLTPIFSFLGKHT